MYCGKCGAPNPDNGKFCTTCGAVIGGGENDGTQQPAAQIQPIAQQVQPAAQQAQPMGYGYNEVGNVISSAELASAKNLMIISTILLVVSILLISPVLIPITAVARSRFSTAQKRNTKAEFEADMKSGQKFLLAAVIIIVLLLLLFMFMM